MDIKIRIKNAISDYNPFAILRRRKMRKALINKTPSLLVPNCLGGHLLHDLGVEFRSPFVNLMMYQTDFYKFIFDMERYLGEELVFFKHPKFTFPCAKLGELTVHFTHYETEEEARSKWNTRKGRIDFDNLFVQLVERDGLSYEQIKSLSALKVRGVMVFTENPYPDIPYTCYIPTLKNHSKGTKILKRTLWDDHKRYEEYFDFVQWFNNANGGDYNVTPFIRKKYRLNK